MKIVFKHELNGETVTVKAKADEVDSYGADNLRFHVYDSDGDEMSLDDEDFEEITEAATEALYDKSFEMNL